MSVFRLRRSRLGRKNQSASMTWLAKARLLSAAIALVSVLSWIAGTNHCFLGLMKEPQCLAASVSHCPGHAKEAASTNNGPSGMLGCCQGLLSPHFEVAHVRVLFFSVATAIPVFAVDGLAQPEAPRSILWNTEYNTGPPRGAFFVGTVLRRSLQENAPPVTS
jgi:hypothetical protein